VIDGRVSIPNQSAGVLVQPDGRDWREFRNTWLFGIGAASVLGMIALLAAFYTDLGPEEDRSRAVGPHHPALHRDRARQPLDGRGQLRLLGLSGLNITYGALLLRPIIGAETFTALTFWGQAVHQYLSFPFVLGPPRHGGAVAARQPAQEGGRRLAQGRRPGGQGPPAGGKFNAAQKALFFFTMGGGALVAVSGYLLMFPMTVTASSGCSGRTSCTG
jgi:formate dehydrogenase subunit gamma